VERKPMSRLLLLLLTLTLAALLAACTGESSPTPTPTPTAAQLLARKLPTNVSSVLWVDIKADQRFSYFQDWADWVMLAITEEVGDPFGEQEFIEMVDSIGLLSYDSVGLDVILVGGDFRDLGSALFQARLETVARSKETYWEVNIFHFALSDRGAALFGLTDGTALFLAFPDSETLLISVSLDRIKEVIHHMTADGAAASMLAEALYNVGPGYVLQAGLPEDFDDPTNPKDFADLDGLALIAWGISVKDSAASTTTVYLRFSDHSKAAAGLAWFQAPERLQENWLGDLGVKALQARQKGNAVVVEFDAPNEEVTFGA
jgi:hypothetical protein